MKLCHHKCTRTHTRLHKCAYIHTQRKGMFMFNMNTQSSMFWVKTALREELSQCIHHYSATCTSTNHNHGHQSGTRFIDALTHVQTTEIFCNKAAMIRECKENNL